MKIPEKPVFSKRKPNEKRKEDLMEMIKIANHWGSRERERESVLLINECFCRSILFVVQKNIENNKKNIDRRRMDYHMDVLKKIFMRI